MALPNTTSLRYKLTGFYPDSTDPWKARGFLVDQSTKFHNPADGSVKYAVIGGIQLPVISLSTAQTEFALT